MPQDRNRELRPAAYGLIQKQSQDPPPLQSCGARFASHVTFRAALPSGAMWALADEDHFATRKVYRRHNFSNANFLLGVVLNLDFIGNSRDENRATGNAKRNAKGRIWEEDYVQPSIGTSFLLGGQKNRRPLFLEAVCFG